MANYFRGYVRVRRSTTMGGMYGGKVGVAEAGAIVSYFSDLTCPNGTPRVEICVKGIYGWVPANELEPLSALAQLALCARETE